MKKQIAIAVGLVFVSSMTPFRAANGDTANEQSTGEMGFSTLGWSVHHGDPQEEKDEKRLDKTVPQLMEKHQYAALDSLAETLRSSKNQYAGGRTALGKFYEALSLPQSATEANWKARLQDLNQWWTQNPNSKTAPAALVDYWGDYAWLARGSGYADTVSQEGWKGFSERLRKGDEVFEKAKANKEICPMLYVFQQRIALGQSWDKEKYNQLVNEAVKKFPNRNEYYFTQAYYLQPRWHGDDKEWPEFAAKVADRVGGTNGDKLYARIAWSILRLGLYDNMFTEFPNLKWSRIDKGLQALEKDYPNSISLQSHRVRFALLANQKPLAKQLLAKLGNNVDIHTWQKKVYFFRTKQELLGEKK